MHAFYAAGSLADVLNRWDCFGYGSHNPESSLAALVTSEAESGSAYFWAVGDAW